MTSLVAQMVKVCLQRERPGFNPWVGKIPWRRKWQPTRVFLPGESKGWRNLAGYSPWGHKESHNWATSLSLSFSFICKAMTLSNSFKKPNLLLISQQTELSGGKKYKFLSHNLWKRKYFKMLEILVLFIITDHLCRQMFNSCFQFSFS